MKIRLFSRLPLLLAALILGAAPSMARAADTSAATPAAASAPAANPAAAAEAAKKKVEEEKAAKEAALHAPFDESLFFSPQDLIAISKAQKGAESNAGGYNGAPIPQKRVITLSGIIYRSPSDWLIWINGQKIVPGRLLPEIVDIQVHENSVHMKWFDIGLNGVIDITMHPHETYDIVTGILLPGSG